MKPVHIALIAAALLVSFDAHAQRRDLQIPAEQAQDFIGRDATVCGKVESANFAENAAGTPTFLHLGAPFPRQPFQVRIAGEHRGNFGFAPEEALKDKVICATGRIARASNRAEIVVRSPSELALAAD
ncbi:MAG: hypothetical protein ACXIUZ_11210 [Lysobacteraceae bacterium]